MTKVDITEDVFIELINNPYEPKDDIAGYSWEIVSEMLYNQVEQGNPRDVSVFEVRRSTPKDDGGFDWDKTSEGKDYWQVVLGGGPRTSRFKAFYEKNQRTMAIYEYMLDAIKGIDFDGTIKGFPREVVAMMMAEQWNQGNPPNLEVFENYAQNSRGDGGFNWNLSPEGEGFWIQVIDDENWALFYEKYPKEGSTLSLKKDISVKEFMKVNKTSLQELEKRDKDVFDLTVTLLTQLQLLEDRQKAPKPKAKKKTKKKTTKPTPKPVVEEVLDFDEDDLDFATGGKIDLQDLDF